MEDWKEYKLKDVCEVINGRAYKQEELLEEGKYRVLRVGNIFQGNNWYYSDLELPEDKYCNKGDLLYAWSCGFAPYIWEGEKTIYHYHIWKLVEDKNIVDKHFLYYYLIENTKNYLGGTHGSVMLHLTKKDMEGQIIKLPSLSNQRKFASILKSLDDKIEVNRRINDNLEQQAQALFKSWFVDFETFKDGEFVESELGMIPKGWKVVELQDVVTIKRGGSPRPIQAFLSSSGYHWLKISDATACQSPYIYEIKEFIKESGLSKTVKLSVGSLVLSNSATPGIPKILGIDSCIHDGWLYFPHSHLSKYYLYMLFKEKRDFLLSQGNGSVFTNLKTDIVKAMQIAIPNNQIMAKFNTVVESLFNQIENKTKESRRLATLRDTLLPKLMSGELKVNEIKE